MVIEPQKHHYTANLVKELLVQHGIKQTSQRIKIGKMLLSKPQHLTADQVFSNPTPHFHLYNEDSGELMDYKAGSKPLKLDDTLELPKGTIASGVDVIIRIKNKV
jgi:hypothetical protein